MKAESFTTIQARVPESFADQFREACKANKTPVSDALRGYMQFIVSQYQAKHSSLDISVKAGEVYGRGKMDMDEYYIEASVGLPEINFQQPAEHNSPIEIKFLLPEFKDENGNEVYRVDSFYSYREIFPGCRNAKGRCLGAKLIKSTEGGEHRLKWEGAIFLYRGDDIAAPLNAKREIEKAVESLLREGVNDYFDALSERFGITLPGRSINSITNEYRSCSITFQHKDGDDFGAWEMTISLNKYDIASSEWGLNKLEIPHMENRIIHFNGRYADYSVSSAGELVLGFRMLNGFAYGYVYSNGVSEERNRTSLAEVSDRLSEIIEDRLAGK